MLTPLSANKLLLFLSCPAFNLNLSFPSLRFVEEWFGGVDELKRALLFTHLRTFAGVVFDYSYVGISCNAGVVMTKFGFSYVDVPGHKHNVALRQYSTSSYCSGYFASLALVFTLSERSESKCAGWGNRTPAQSLENSYSAIKLIPLSFT